MAMVFFGLFFLILLTPLAYFNGEYRTTTLFLGEFGDGCGE
jgi:hypothetical protein